MSSRTQPLNTAGAALNYEDKDLKKKNKYEEGFVTGYKNARADLAEDLWQAGTGRGEEKTYTPKTYKRIKIETQEVNGVTYDEHFETVEVYT